MEKTSEALLLSELLRLLPKEALITRLEYEGPFVAIYSKNPIIFFENPSIVTSLAAKFKRRFVIRSEPRERKDVKEARNEIEKILLLRGIDPSTTKIILDEARGEVTIFTPKYLPEDKKSALIKEIVERTLWIPTFRWYFRELPRVISKVSAIQVKMEPIKFLSYIGDRVFRVPVNPSRFIRIVALGGAGEVGRSAILVSTTESNVLIDFGVKIGATQREELFPRIDLLDIHLNEIDAVILTHAHLDHCGLIPFLYKHGYRGPVYMTEPTLPLTVLLLEDYYELMKMKGEVLFNENDISTMIRHAITLKYNQVTGISPDIKLTFINAGHILGSAMVHLHITEGVHNILITGDFKYGPTKLLEPAKTDFSRAETLVMEATYGDRHDILPSRSETESMFAKLVKKTIERGGKVLIPVFGVGRSQEVLTVIYTLSVKETNQELALPKVPVYIDGMIDEANKVHEIYIDYLKSHIRKEFKETGESPFNTDYLIPVTKSSIRDEIINERTPSIILSTSGMMQGGPVIEYFKSLALDERNMLLFVTYQAADTLGRKIADGARKVELVYDGRLLSIDVNMQVKRLEGFSGHSDRRQLLGFVNKIQNLIKNVYLVHGELSKIENLASTIQSFFKIPAFRLKLSEPVVLRH
ncbi:MAG: beta-CASP ribonuclease aCPSF1 [Candidatus Geothermarchaeota archaeon]